MTFSMRVQAEEKFFSNIDIVEIDSVVASVFLTASNHETSVKMNYKKKNPAVFDLKCKIEFLTKQQTVKLKSNVLNKEDGKNCELEIYISLPSQKTVNVSLAQGDVYARGAFFKIATEMAAGKILLGAKKGVKESSSEGVEGFSTKFAALNIASGEVEMNFDVIPEQANILVEMASGTVLLSSNKLPKSGAVSFELGYADSEVSFPKGEAFRVDFSSAWGKLTSELPITEKSDFSVHFSAGVGKMKVLEKKKS